ncbi:N-succinyl-L,L-diaminopimelate aminotransferase, type 2 [hydrothermal vent metagenome]|uniref:N-succinyl-L,L-diaminopimelate aminotransferase, type 2 n=1 Tax=hydrothermal vent metagenome TaxID=652676 RepID=A0A3B0UDW6_9ZZZZ
MSTITDPPPTQAGPPPAAGARSPFARLRELLGDLPPGADPIDLSIGEPRHPFPPLVGEVLSRELAGFGKYPPAKGTAPFRAAVGAWADRRYGLGGGLDPDTSILPLAGSREGLFLVALLAAERARARGVERPAFVLPNPFYQTYAAAIHAAGGEAIFLPAIRQNGYLPDLGAVAAPIRARLAAIYLCSPANPQGAVADLEYWRRLIGFARAHDAIVLADECYSEIYRDIPPPGVLEAADGDFSSVLSFNSLSKRSNLPGLRLGFVAGDPALIAPFATMRNIAAATVPLPILAVAQAVYGEETHVAETRALYNDKFKAAAEILGHRFGHQTPPGAFFLWLDMSEVEGEGGGATRGEAAALHLWREAGVKVVPGSYLSATPESGADPGADYIRIALVGTLEETETALIRLAKVFA